MPGHTRTHLRRSGNKWRGSGQGQPTPLHTQCPTQPPFPHRRIYKKLLKCWFSHFSTRAHQRTNGPMQRTDKASYRVACPQLKRKRTNWNINSCTKVQEQLPTPPLHHPLPPIYVSSNGGCLIKNSRFPISVLLSYEISSQVNRKGYDKIHRNCKEREKLNLWEKTEGMKEKKKKKLV